MDDRKDMMDLNTDDDIMGQDSEFDMETAAELSPAKPAEPALDLKDERAVREALEAARASESKAYKGMSNAATLTRRQQGVLELAELEEVEKPTKAQLDEKCKLILESYYLPHIAKDGFTAKLDPDFTRGEEPDRDYIEAKFTNSSGKVLTAGYNYKPDKDGRNILIFEKSFQNIVLKPGEPEKYVLYDADGEKELEAITVDELPKKIASGEVVKVEEGYFLKAKDADGQVKEGTTTPIVEDEGLGNVRIVFGNNEQCRYSIGKNGQLTCATTNDVTTANIETRSFASPGPIYDSADAARAAAEKELREGEANPRISVTMEGTSVADFNFLPAFTTSVELAGLSRKLGKGIEGYDASVSDEENLRRQLAKPIREYLDEKGFYVIDIVCENLMADVSENVGFMNTIKTYQMTGGVISVSYIKKLKTIVSIKQGFLGRGQGNNVDAIIAQLPAGSELLNPENINWKNSKEEVAYVTRSKATGTGAAKNTIEADEKAAENAITEAQRMVARTLNGGIASGIREAISGRGACSTVASVRGRLNAPVATKDDMEFTHKDPKYAYAGSCDRMVTNTENKLVSVTAWGGHLLTFVEAKEPVLDKGIPTDENYEKYINDGDDSGILLFEKDDMGLHRYMKDVLGAQSQTKIAKNIYLRERGKLQKLQAAFDKLIDERLGVKDSTGPEEVVEVVEEAVTPEDIAEVMPEGAEEQLTAKEALMALFGDTEEPADKQVTSPVVEEPISAQVPAMEEASAAAQQMTAQEALMSIFGDVPAEPVTETPIVQEPVPVAAPVVDEPAPVAAPFMEEPVPAAVPVVNEPVPAVAPAMEAPPATERQMTAQEALMSIFGDVPAEPVTENPVVQEPVPVAAPVVEEPIPVAAPVVEEPIPVAAPVMEGPIPVVAPVVEEPIPVAAPVMEDPVPAAVPAMEEDPAVERQMTAQEALMSIFGDVPAEPVTETPIVQEPVPVAAPVVEEPIPVAAPVMEGPIPVVAPVMEEPIPAAVPSMEEAPATERQMTAQEALMSIFGDVPAEPVAENPVVQDPVPLAAPFMEDPTPVAAPIMEEQIPVVEEVVSDMPVFVRREPEAPVVQTVATEPGVMPMPDIPEGGMPVGVVRERPISAERMSGLDAGFVMPMPDIPDLPDPKPEESAGGSMQTALDVDAAWEQLVNGVLPK